MTNHSQNNKPASTGSRRRIAMIAYSIYETDRRIRNYAEALAENGDRVDVIVLAEPNAPRTMNRVNGVNLFRVQRRRFDDGRILQYVFRILLFCVNGSIRLAFEHVRWPYDLVHVHNVPDYLVFAAFVPKIFGAKIVLDIHDIMPEFFCQKFSRTMGSRIARILLFVERLSTRFADHVIVANHLWRRRVQTRNGLPACKTTAFLNYPDLNKFHFVGPESRDSGHRVLYPGTISKHHGVDLAIQAMAGVVERFPDAQLHIYGRPRGDALRSYLMQLIVDLGLSGNVLLFEPVPLEALQKVYADAAVGVVPKRPGIFSSDAFSTKIFDFFASGLPAVVSRTTVDEYYFDESLVRYFEPENVESLVSAICSVFEDQSLRRRLTSNALQFAQHNSLDTKIVTYLRLVERLIDKGEHASSHEM